MGELDVDDNSNDQGDDLLDLMDKAQQLYKGPKSMPNWKCTSTGLYRTLVQRAVVV